MKRKLLFIGAFAFGAALTAQTQVGNSGFETWTSSGNPDQEPSNWNSMMTGDFSCTFCGIGQVQTIWEESTIINSGSKSVKLETQDVTFARVNGTVTLGEIGTTAASASDGYTRTIPGDADFSEAFTDMPDSIVFWANYTSNSGGATDFASAAAILHGPNMFWNPTTHPNYDPTELTAKAELLFVSTSGWERKAVAFDYSAGTFTGVNHILLTFSSTDVAGASASRIGDLLYVDDVLLIYNITPSYAGLTNLCPGDSGPIAFSSNSTTTVDRIFNLELSDATGSFASPTVVGTTTITAGNPGSGNITGTVPMGTPPGSGYKLRVTQSDASYASIAGPAFAVDPVETAGTLASSNVTNCTSPDGAVTLAGASGSSFELFDSGNSSIGTNATGNFTGLNAGDYYVVVSGTNCDATTNTVTVANASAPSAPTAGTDADYCDGDTQTDLTAATGSGGILNWYSDGGLTNNIGTGVTLTPVNTIGITIYYVTETLAGCESAPNTVTVTVGANPTMSGEVAGAVMDCTNADGMVTVTSDGTSFELFDSGNTTQGTNATGAFTGVAAGTYYVVATLGNCTTQSSNVTVADNTSMNTVSASPTATQTIAVATAGTMITATESSASANGEWKVSNVSGSGYNSFSPVETALTYTPNFAAGGTYYVVYTATINNCMLMSGETEIIVGNVGIGENENGNVTVYSFEKQVFIDLSNTSLKNPTVKLVSINGKVVLERRLNSGSMNTLNVDVPTGVYIFHIISNEGAVTGKVVLK